jgi:hypothetical protein
LIVARLIGVPENKRVRVLQTYKSTPFHYNITRETMMEEPPLRPTGKTPSNTLSL